MSWRAQKGSLGFPVWSGADQIFDPYHLRRKARWWGVRSAALAIIVMIAAAIAGMVFELTIGEYAPLRPIARVVDRDALTFGTAGVIFALELSLLWMVIRRYPLPSEFITRRWRLNACPHALTFEAGAFSPALESNQVAAPHWTVGLDEISRVECGLTREWQPLRHYQGGPVFANDRSTGFIFSSGVLQVPAAEYQTFVFLIDGSRQVIHTANADREGAGMLAHSIRCWVEEMRTRAKKIAPAPKAGMAVANERREGFDI